MGSKQTEIMLTSLKRINSFAKKEKGEITRRNDANKEKCLEACVFLPCSIYGYRSFCIAVIYLSID